MRTHLIYRSLICAIAWTSGAAAGDVTYFEDFSVDGTPPPEYASVGGATLSVSGGALIVSPSGGDVQQGFELTYPETIGGEDLDVFCTEFEVDLPAILPVTDDQLEVTFFESPASIKTTAKKNSDGTYELRVEKNGMTVFLQTNVVLEEGFVKYRWDRVGDRVMLEKVRKDGTFETLYDVDPPPGNPFSSVVFTTNTEGFSIGSILAGPHQAEVAVPTVSEWGLIVMALVLLAGATIVFRKRSVAPLVVLLLCMPAVAQTVTTAKTSDIDLGTVDQGTGIAGVTVKKTIKVSSTATAGTVTVQCKFSNTNADPKTFAFCNMIGLKSTFPKVPTVKCCYFSVLANPTNVECIVAACGTAPFPAMVQPNYHFGCTVVTVPGMTGGMPGMFTTLPSTSGAHGKFKNKKASDFEVIYADIIDMTGLTFDSAGTCNDCFKECSFTAVGSSLLGATPIAGTWVTIHTPFKDPFIAYDDGPIEYASFADTPCVPSYFPQSVPQLPVCPGGPVPDFFDVDINLFYFDTMAIIEPQEDATDPTPAFLTFETAQPLPLDVSIETDPAPLREFMIPPIEETFGKLTVHSPATMAEGTKVDVTLLVHDADTGDPLFPQHYTFTHDTVPPEVVSPAVVFVDGSGFLQAEVTTFDVTTEPLNAVLWVSTDSGSTWSFHDMEPQSPLLEDHSTRTFGGQAGPFDPGTVLRFFFSTQDTLENVRYFGCAELTVTVVPTVSEWGLIVMALLLLTAGTIVFARRRRPAVA